MAVGESVEELTEKVQRVVDKVNNWTRKYLIIINNAKSVYEDYVNKNVNIYQ
jgi:hypothetical protein